MIIERLSLKRLFHLLILAVIVSWTLWTGCAPAEITAEDVIAKYGEAIGGAEQLLNLKSRVTNGQFSVPEMGISGSYVSYLLPPNRFYNEISIANMKASSGLRDGVAWEMNPMTGDRILEGGEKWAALRRACWDPVIEWNLFYDEAELQEQDPGAKTFKVAMNSKKNRSQALAYFDRQTGFLTKLITFDDGRRTATWFSDYKPVDGLILPHQVTSDMGGQIKIEMKVEKIEHDSEIEPSTFDFPEAIRKLLDE